MLDRVSSGELPAKAHTILRSPEGVLRYEECLTRSGFDGPYTICYHLRPPHAQHLMEARYGWPLPEAVPARPLAKRHYRALSLPSAERAAIEARRALLFNDDVVLSVLSPKIEDPAYFSNGDGDDLYFIQEGGGTLRSLLGELRFTSNDYVFVPRGLLHRFLPDAGVPQQWLNVECLGGASLPQQWRNEVGQLRMDAPYSHRDFRRTEFQGPLDEGIRELVVKRSGAFHGFRYDSSPLDVVGWDGTVYPWAFPMLCFQPRVSSVHLPPTWHGTFRARGALICSFVPRPLDFHPEAIACPYPHSSVDVDEVIFYCRGEFTSRKGIGPGSISHHPAGIGHGPHPGAYEHSIGARHTDELAVMLDCHRPLQATKLALSLEDPEYQESFVG